MKIRNKIALIISLLLVFGSTLATAQQRYSYWSLGPSLGTSHYFGDFGASVRPAFGFMVNYHFMPHFLVRFTFNRGSMAGEDAVGIDTTSRNLHFRSPITEFSGQIVYDLFAVEGLYRHRPVWSPFFFTGISVFTFNPQAQPDPAWVSKYPGLFSSAEEWVDLKPLGTEGQYLLDPDRELPEPYALTQIAIPLGVGIRYKLTNKIDLRFEAGIRFTFTGYLDDVSGVYAPYNLIAEQNGTRAALFSDRRPIEDETLRQPGGERSESSANDMFGFTNFSISFILDRGDRCPPRFRKSQR